MTSVPDAWDDEWSASADVGQILILQCRYSQRQQPAANADPEQEPKRLTTKQSKAQKRAQQAEFNRQLWAEA